MLSSNWGPLSFLIDLFKFSRVFIPSEHIH
jgi:hypothetical protein